jgi:integrase/recombinase XerC
LTGREAFLRELAGRNVSPATITAYRTDLTQFLTWLQETNLAAVHPSDVQRIDVSEYLAYLADQGRTGVTWARKLAAIREYFRALVAIGQLPHSPAEAISIPKKERRSRTYLRPDEYTKLLSAAGGHPRDYCILQLFLQTGIRVSELVALTLDDIDLTGRVLRVEAGKGQKAREIALEKKGLTALRNYLKVRPVSTDRHLFLNYEGVGISDRGVKKLIEKYRKLAGIEKQVSCHSLRHTFASAKAAQGVSAFQLKEWLGHANLNTTQIYVHMGKQNSRRAMEATSL